MLRSIGVNAAYKRMMIVGYDSRAQLLSLAMFGEAKHFTHLCGLRTYTQESSCILESFYGGKTYKLVVTPSKDEVDVSLFVDGSKSEHLEKVKTILKFKEITR